MNLENQFEKLCKHEYIYGLESLKILPEFRCKVIGQNYCRDPHGLVNFYRPYFCELRENNLLFVLVAIFIIYLNFRYLALVIEEYCTVGIFRIKGKLGISQDLAGVTLIALTIGFGDVITAFIASDQLDGVLYNVGTIYGSGLFVGCCVVSTAIFHSKTKNIIIGEMVVKRDLSFYILTTVVVLIIGWIGEITWMSSVIMFFIYFCQVVFVMCEDRQKRQKKLRRKKSRASKSVTSTEVISNDSIISQEEKLKAHDDKHHHTKIIDYPFVFLSYFTLLPVETKHYSRKRCLIFSFTGFLFMNFMMFTRKLNMLEIYVQLILSVFLFALFLYLLPRKGELPSEKVQTFITVLSLMATTFWIYFLIEILFNILSVLGMIYGLNNSYLGFTILAIGNSLPDLFNTLTLLSGEGMKVMALSGAYNG
jgi:Ca2+/Na+ antiporter